MLKIIKKCFNLLLKPVKIILFKIKLLDMDEQWYLSWEPCWSLFPPSFYYTHTEEEIERITAETIERIRKLIDEL